MKQFLDFLVEGKNLHMEHIEDSVLNEGSSGVIEAISFMESVVDMLDGNTKSSINVTVKWDGAPAVFAGINPENGKFFVATKSLFNVTPKINYTNADIDKNHSGQLAAKLKIALANLGKLGIRGILQGDIMFTSGDMSTENIDGESHIVFQPNTISYAVPANSKLAKEMSNAKIGVVWHTKYTGKTIKELKASFNPQVSSLAKTRAVWFSDADFRDTSGTATFTKKETNDINSLLADCKNKLRGSKRFIDSLLSQTKIISEIKIYSNSLVRQGAGGTESAAGFINYMESKMQKSIDSLKSEAGKKRKESVKKELIAYLGKNSSKLDLMFALRVSLVKAKLYIIRKLEKVKQIGTFIKTENGFRVTSPEGFVAVDRMSNKALKLVDRLEFSMQNFTAAKNWDK
jgi:hypothetical protein